MFPDYSWFEVEFSQMSWFALSLREIVYAFEEDGH